MRRAAVIVLMILRLFSSAAAQSSPSSAEAKVDNLFEPWSKPGLPGAAVAVVKDGKPLLLKGYGCADIERLTPITPQTLFNAASLAKQFTAFSVQILAEQGKAFAR